jgi:hypothetical protein
VTGSDRAYRLAVAREALERYYQWQKSDGDEGLSFEVVGQLACCTRWLTEELWQENPEDATAIPIRRRPPAEARARLLEAGLPVDFVDEMIRKEKP